MLIISHLSSVSCYSTVVLNHRKTPQMTVSHVCMLRVVYPSLFVSLFPCHVMLYVSPHALRVFLLSTFLSVPFPVNSFPFSYSCHVISFPHFMLFSFLLSMFVCRVVSGPNIEKERETPWRGMLCVYVAQHFSFSFRICVCVGLCNIPYDSCTSKRERTREIDDMREKCCVSLPGHYHTHIVVVFVIDDFPGWVVQASHIHITVTSSSERKSSSCLRSRSLSVISLCKCFYAFFWENSVIFPFSRPKLISSLCFQLTTPPSLCLWNFITWWYRQYIRDCEKWGKVCLSVMWYDIVSLPFLLAFLSLSFIFFSPFVIIILLSLTFHDTFLSSPCMSFRRYIFRYLFSWRLHLTFSCSSYFSMSLLVLLQSRYLSNRHTDRETNFLFL